jgi:hypothetical protein
MKQPFGAIHLSAPFAATGITPGEALIENCENNMHELKLHLRRLLWRVRRKAREKSIDGRLFRPSLR